ncbi:MAG TPA: CARDB domain-containing protein, partial [Accumulibacter sp.]|uniref:CARDB domain-containing protein n=1 Tax=Accumulibacter sp. TaxID=2053492 RepID=UPI002B8E670A
VWSDTYDLILEDTLATSLNPDDPAQVDNNNYKARPISILGITPPDLVVKDVQAPASADAEGLYTFAYSVQNRGDFFSGGWTDSVYLTDNPDFAAAREVWHLGDYGQTRSLGNGEIYSVTQSVQLATSAKGRYLIVRTDAGNRVGESNEGNNTGAIGSVVSNRPADLQVTEIRTEPSNYSGEETTITWTVGNFGAAVWAGTRSWVDTVYLSPDPSFIPGRATLLGSFTHANVEGMASGGSYTTSAKVRLPVGAEGPYYIYVITDADPETRAARSEIISSGDNESAKVIHAATAFEGLRNDNNIGRGSLSVIYAEPDLQVDTIAVAQANPASGQPLTVTWTVTNRGTRATRSGSWYDGLYLSRDASLDNSDYALVDRGSPSEAYIRLKAITVPASDLAAGKFLRPGESYTATATFNVPESISGDFRLIVKADTAIGKDGSGYERSSIRDGLPGLIRFTDPAGGVLEFQDEGNNSRAIALTIDLATPPDLQVAHVTAPASILAGQTFTVNYRVVNQGGNTPSDQRTWNDLVYLSKDRFLDVNQDRYLGYLQHDGGLAGGAGYDASLTVSAPKNLEGPYYVFVVSDPARAWGTGEYGKVREFGKEQNNATAAAQPLLIETPPPADLKVTNIVLPASAQVGDELRLDYTITNDSINPAYGRWTDAVYLSADSGWDLGDILLGKVDHIGDLAGGASYGGTLTAKLPPLKDGNWRIIVRPDLYNEVFEGKISYSVTGLNLPPGEANNRMASGATLAVSVPTLTVATPLATTLSPGEARLYKLSVAAGETLRVSLDAAADEGSNELYIRYGDIPTGYAFDAAYDNPVAADQEAMIPSTKAGDYYILVRARQGNANAPVTLRADLLPLSITRVTPDQGGTGDDEHRWVTLDIHGSHFKAGALVKLTRPGIAESEPERWQVLDATHIRAVFDTRKLPHGLYDVSVSNPDGQRVSEAQRYLVERGIEADVTIGIGGARNLNPGESSVYSLSLQSLSNLDTPYVRFDFGVPEMGRSEDVLAGLNLPYLVFGSNVDGQPDGLTVDSAGNTQTYGATPTDGTPRSDIPWARLDGVQNTAGFNLAPGYAFDIPAGGFVGMSFNVQTYPGLAEWIAHDFEGLRAKLYAVRPDWAAQRLLDGGVQDLDKIQEGLAAKFLWVDKDQDNTHISKLEALAMPFRFNVAGAATPLTRDEFIADQTAHAKRLRGAILADTSAPANLSALAADEGQWVTGWLGALEAAGLLRPSNEAPPIRDNPQVLSLNATLATGILLSKGGDSYRTQADLLGFFAKVQQWYGDTARYGGDPKAAKAEIDYTEVRQGGTYDQDVIAEIPVPVMANPADYDLNA